MQWICILFYSSSNTNSSVSCTTVALISGNSLSETASMISTAARWIAPRTPSNPHQRQLFEHIRSSWLLIDYYVVVRRVLAICWWMLWMRRSPLVLAKGSVGKYSLKRNGDRVPKATSNWDEDRNGWMMVMEAIRSKPAKAGHPPWGVIPILTVRAEAMPKFIWQVLNGAIVSDGQHVGYIFPHLGMKPPGSMNGG
jgi:hypothetical protein